MFAVAYRNGSFTRGSNCKALSGKQFLVSWIGGRLWAVVANVRWSLMGGGRLLAVVAYGRWSLMGGGRLWAVVAYGRWSLMGGGRLWAVVAYGRWSHIEVRLYDCIEILGVYHLHKPPGWKSFA